MQPKALTYKLHCNHCGRDATLTKPNTDQVVFHCPYCASTQLYLEPVVPALDGRPEGLYADWDTSNPAHPLLRLQLVNGDRTVTEMWLAASEAAKLRDVPLARPTTEGGHRCS